MNNKKVSVIIPFYNEVSWLCDAVESVLNQDYNNLEIIVINDGSRENMNDFMALYGEKIKYYYKTNGGPASARNIGLKMATGDYVAFLDSDDVWLPDKTKKQIAFMEDSGIMWSHTGYYNWYPQKNQLIQKNNFNDYGDVYLRSFISLKAPTPAIIIKKEILDKHTDFYFFEDMRFSEDSILWSKIAIHYKLGLLKEPLIKVRRRGTNADLSSLVRFKSKKDVYNKSMSEKFPNIPISILKIYSIYMFLGKILEILKKKFSLKTSQLEFLGKLFWITPFIIERLYIIIINKNNKKDNNYIR